MVLAQSFHGVGGLVAAVDASRLAIVARDDDELELDEVVACC